MQCESMPALSDSRVQSHIKTASPGVGLATCKPAVVIDFAGRPTRIMRVAGGGTSMRTTVTLDDDHVAHLDAIREHEDEPDAAVVRRCVERSQELTATEQRVTECEQTIDELEAEIEALEADHETELEQKDARIRELNNKLAEAHSRIDTTNELVERVEGELTARERREQRERKKAEAGLLRRAKWAVFGMDLDDDE